MGRLLSLVLFLFSFSAMQSQVLDSMFVNMPSGIIPYLEKDQRLDLIDFAQAKRQALVQNALDDTCQLEVYTPGYFRLKLSTVNTLELKLIADQNKQPYVLLCETVCAEGCDSKLGVYDTAWKRVEAPLLTTLPKVTDFVKEKGFIGQVADSYPFPMIRASLSDRTDDIEFRLYISPLLDKKQWQQVAPLLNPSVKRTIQLQIKK